MSMTKWIIVIVVLAVVIGVLYAGMSGRLNQFWPKDIAGETPTGNITLNYWGTQEDESVLRPVLEEYEKSHPNVKVNYIKQSLVNYRTRVQTQMRAGQGPDILSVHQSWVPMFYPDLAPAPESIISPTDFNNSYYQVIRDKMMINGQVYAVPSEIDGLVVFYNQDLLKFANVAPPVTWQDFMTASRKMTVPPEGGAIQTAGAAMGSTSNVDYWPEIVGTLFMQQPDGDVTRPNNRDGQEVPEFFSQFVTSPKQKTWDSTLPSSTQMFINGKLAFYIAPSKKARQISQSNPSLGFRTSPLPQLPAKQASWATFWGAAVSSRSKNQAQAWELLKYLSSPETLKLINQHRVQNKQLPLAYPRPDMASDQVNDPILGAVIKQGGYFKTWYLNSDTSDDGINDEMIKVFEKIFSVGGRVDSSKLDQATGEIEEVLSKYGVGR